MKFEEFIHSLENVRRSGDGVTARCPAHGDTNNSFSATQTEDRILIHCHAQCTAEQICAAMGLSISDLFVHAQNGYSGNGNRNSQSRPGLTIEDFAKAKGFEVDFLSGCGVAHDKGGGLVFHYLLMDGQRAARQRIRLSLNGDKKFIWNKAAGRPVPYGLWHLHEARKAGTDLSLVEGESDALTLWVHGIAAIGIPGADMCKTLQAPHVAGFRRVLIVRENDHGGEVFKRGCIGRLAELEFDGQVAIIEMTRAEVKDANDLHVKFATDASAFKSEWQALILMARGVELPRTGILLTRLETVTPQRVEWFWPNRFPTGNTSLLAGMPGVGKSTLCLDIAARASRGRAFADGAKGFGPADILIITGEDNIASVVVPRLRELGADMSRITALKTVAAATQSGEIGQRGFNLSTDLPLLRNTLTRSPGIKLVIIDPLSSFLGRTDAHKEAEMRGFVMTPLFTVAEDYKIAVIIIVHLNKGSGSPLQRISGSVGIAGAARMVWACVADPEKPRSLMLPVKLNLAKDIGGLAYNIVSSRNDPEIATLTWEDGAVYQRVEDVFAEEAEQRADGGGAKLEAAKTLWREMLAAGPRLCAEVEEKARELRISERTLRRAKSDSGVKSEKRGYPGRWWASLGER